MRSDFEGLDGDPSPRRQPLRDRPLVPKTGLCATINFAQGAQGGTLHKKLLHALPVLACLISFAGTAKAAHVLDTFVKACEQYQKAYCPLSEASKIPQKQRANWLLRCLEANQDEISDDCASEIEKMKEHENN